MVEIREIRKSYGTGKNSHIALNNINLSFRKNEFVAILGPSGSGKTTLLNIIGGLDHYDSGDLVIDHISTSGYSPRDWDSYRNHSIGFIFQSYNLIQHQNILSNVEMALTISGISGKQRKDMAAQALAKVGLGDQLTKLPNQLSGGQMQRVAIARALVNNPKIVLADEPTGALDSKTSVQVMELLKEVAQDRLIIMVTHNPELAERYATRIITLKDGEIISDTDPYVPEQEPTEAVRRNMGHASMNMITALSLSFHNLWTKRSRTLLTAFAGSIGIIGIALIAALSSGVDDYVYQQEAKMAYQYPLLVETLNMDVSSMLSDL
ncbi:MAG: ABC transporter ATP-binding protein, partial [Ruminococcus sp.]